MKHAYFSSRVLISALVLFTLLSNVEAQSTKPKKTKAVLERLPVKSLTEIFCETKLVVVYVPEIKPARARLMAFSNRGVCSFGNTPNRLNEKQILTGFLKNYDNKPCSGRVIILGDRNRKYRICVTDSMGRFRIDSFETFNRMSINTGYWPQQQIGFDFKFNGVESYLTHIVYNYVDINLKKHYSYYHEILEFVIPSEDFKEKEKSVKAKFRFRDVKQLDTRYTDIYLRY